MMLVEIRKSLIVLLVLSMSACQSRISTESQLIKYIQDPGNNLKKFVQQGGIDISLAFQPWQLLNTHRIKSDLSNKDFVKNKYFFVLSLSKNNKELLRQLQYSTYSELVQVLSFRMASYISLISDGNPSEEIDDCLFQQTYGMARSNQILLVINSKKLINVKTFRIQIREFGLQTGDLNFDFSMKDINSIPFHQSML